MFLHSTSEIFDSQFSEENLLRIFEERVIFWRKTLAPGTNFFAVRLALLLVRVAIDTPWKRLRKFIYVRYVLCDPASFWSGRAQTESLWEYVCSMHDVSCMHGDLEFWENLKN